MKTRLLALVALAVACTPASPTTGPGGATGGGAACSDFERRDPGGACVAYGWKTCGGGFAPSASGRGCEPVLAPACPPSARAALGSTDCLPVGWRDCPVGFSAAPGGSGCVPTLPGARCTGATRESVGSADCVPVGDCAAPFPPPEAQVFVDDSYTAAQVDASHFTTITAAVRAAGKGVVVAVEAGTYPGAVTLNRDVSLVGRCAAQVKITGAPPAGPGIDVTAAASVRLKGLTVSGFDTGIFVEGGAVAEAEGLIVEKATRVGIAVGDYNTKLTLSRSVVRDGQADATGKFGQGMAVAYGATLTLDDVALTDNREQALLAQSPGTVVSLRRVYVGGTKVRQSTGQYGWGLAVQRQAKVFVVESAIVDNVGACIATTEPGSAVTVSASYLARTRVGLDNLGETIAAGAVTSGGGKLVVERSLVADHPYAGLDVFGAGSVLEVRDATVTRCGKDAPLLPARGGVWTENAAVTSLARTAILDCHGVGANARGKGARVTATDVLVAGVHEREAGTGWGMLASSEGVITATRVHVARATASGFAAFKNGAIVAEDVLAEDTVAATRPGADGLGTGMTVDASRLTLTRAVLRRNVVAGLFVDTAAAVTAADVLVTDIAPAADGTGGYGFTVQGGAAMTLDRAGVVRATTIGVHVQQDGSLLTARELTVEHTQPHPTRDRGWGVQAQYGARLELSDALLVDNYEVGAYALGATVNLADTLVLGVARSQGRGLSEGVVVANEGVLRVARGRVSGADTALVFDAGAATVQGCEVSGNTVALQAQDGSTLAQADAVPESPARHEVVVSHDTRFENNAVLVGSGEVPLPPAP